jgi:protein TonB
MSAHALHFPERPHVLRWTSAGFAIVVAHAAAVAALIAWYQRTPPEQPLMPAIMISLAPAAPAVVEHADAPVVQEKMEKVEETPPEPPKIEEPKIEEAKIEQPPEEVAPPPPRPAEITLPKSAPKPVERKSVEQRPIEKRHAEKKPVEKQPQSRDAQDKAATREAARQWSAAASNAYSSLVYGHLQRFKGYPASANSAIARVVVRFVLNRAGNVLSASVGKSSGNAALDAEALATVRRANPFPPFPEGKTNAQETFSAPMDFKPS